MPYELIRQETSTDGDVVVKIFYDAEWEDYQIETYFQGKKYTPWTMFEGNREKAIKAADYAFCRATQGESGIITHY